jgi:hypothetical protein
MRKGLEAGTYKLDAGRRGLQAVSELEALILHLFLCSLQETCPIGHTCRRRRSNYSSATGRPAAGHGPSLVGVPPPRQYCSKKVKGCGSGEARGAVEAECRDTGAGLPIGGGARISVEEGDPLSPVATSIRRSSGGRG